MTVYASPQWNNQDLNQHAQREKWTLLSGMSIFYKARQSTDSFRLLPTTEELHFAHYPTHAADTSTVTEVQSELSMQRPRQTHTSWKGTFTPRYVW